MLKGKTFPQTSLAGHTCGGDCTCCANLEKLRPGLVTLSSDSLDTAGQDKNNTTGEEDSGKKRARGKFSRLRPFLAARQAFFFAARFEWSSTGLLDFLTRNR